MLIIHYFSRKFSDIFVWINYLNQKTLKKFSKFGFELSHYEKTVNFCFCKKRSLWNNWESVVIREMIFQFTPWKNMSYKITDRNAKKYKFTLNYIAFFIFYFEFVLSCEYKIYCILFCILICKFPWNLNYFTFSAILKFKIFKNIHIKFEIWNFRSQMT